MNALLLEDGNKLLLNKVDEVKGDDTKVLLIGVDDIPAVEDTSAVEETVALDSLLLMLEVVVGKIDAEEVVDGMNDGEINLVEEEDVVENVVGPSVVVDGGTALEDGTVVGEKNIDEVLLARGRVEIKVPDVSIDDKDEIVIVSVEDVTVVVVSEGGEPLLNALLVVSKEEDVVVMGAIGVVLVVGSIVIELVIGGAAVEEEVMTIRLGLVVGSTMLELEIGAIVVVDVTGGAVVTPVVIS